VSSAASDSVTLDFIQSCLDNDCVGISDSDCLHYTKAFVFEEIMQQSNKATFIVLVVLIIHSTTPVIITVTYIQ